MARFRAFGVTIETNERLAVPLPSSTEEPDLQLSVQDEPPDGLAVDALAPLYVEGRRADGLPHFAYHRLADRDVVQLIGAMDFHCWPDRIVCHVRVHQHRYLLEIALFGMILALWLERVGRLTLHASSVVVDGRAVAFSSRQGGGKTSTVAAFMAAGHPLLADDLLAIEQSARGMHAHPGYPQLRLWPEQVRHFVGEEHGYPTFHPGHDKRRVTVRGRIGSFHDRPVPIARVYLPRRSDRRDDSVVIDRLAARHAAKVLLTQSYLPREMAAFGLHARRLAFIARLLEEARVATVVVPQGLDQLPRVVEAVEADLRATSGE